MTEVTTEQACSMLSDMLKAEDCAVGMTFSTDAAPVVSIGGAGMELTFPPSVARSVADSLEPIFGIGDPIVEDLRTFANLAEEFAMDSKGGRL